MVLVQTCNVCKRVRVNVSVIFHAFFVTLCQCGPCYTFMLYVKLIYLGLQGAQCELL